MVFPLEGIRVLDFTYEPGGQIPTLLMAEMGADVIKIERPGIRESFYSMVHDDKKPSSELMRRELAANALDRSKRSFALNLKTDAGREAFYRLSRKSDVVIEGHRPGVMKRLGIDYDTVKKMNPRIIYCGVTAYGQDGPYSQFPGRDLTCIGLSGILGVINEGGLPPIVPGVKIADLAAAMYATIGILLALVVREKTGCGQFVDIAMLDGAISWLILPLIRYFENGQVQPDKGDVFLSGKRPGYNIYKAKDGKYFCIAMRQPLFWEKLCQKLGRRDLLPYQNPDNDKQNEIISELSNIFLTKNRDEWLQELKDVGVSKVNVQLDDVVSDPQVLHRSMFVEVSSPGVGTFKQIVSPIKLSETPFQVRGPAPAFGQHTESVLKELGYSQEERKGFMNQKW